MRVIKFRAWDKDMREMVSVDAIQFKDYSTKARPHIIDQHNDIRDLDEIELMQFTGLFDKNGKEIYEWDILKSEDGILLVNWNQHFASFCLDKKGWMYSHWFGESTDSKKCEVIGNIYQDAHLLKP